MKKHKAGNDLNSEWKKKAKEDYKQFLKELKVSKSTKLKREIYREMFRPNLKKQNLKNNAG